MSVLDPIKTIVVAMMENRSFDHLLGTSSLATYGGRTELDGLSGAVDPASQEIANPLYDNFALGHRFRPFVSAHDDALVTDIPHERDAVATQLDFSPVIGGFAMAGFAKAYFEAFPGNRGSPPEPLAMFPPQLVPMTSFLASHFAVCDRWFAPIPTSTQPNRFMALSGFTSVDSTIDGPPDQDIVTDWCTRNGVRWRVYHEGFSFMTLFRRRVLIDPNFRSFDDLARDFQSEPDGTFPQFILVEPEYADDPFARHPDDNHPPWPIGPGEAFLSRVYRAVTSNPARWAGTVLIVTYDEHGGLFDHVPPLPIATVAPKGEYPAFKTTGPRVPALIVSPYVAPRSVCHQQFDHTSILRLLGEKFRADATYSPLVSARQEAGSLASVASALNASVASSPPPEPPAVGTVLAPSYAEPRTPVTPLQKAFARARSEGLATYPDAIAERHPEMLFHEPHPGTGKT